MKRLFLVGDIGGTNTNLALAEHNEDGINLLQKSRFSTQEEHSLLDPVRRFLQETRGYTDGRKIDFCCISGAGPVQSDQSIQLTNAPWAIRADELERVLQTPVKLINDFTALSYAITLLDYRDKREVTQMPHSDGALPTPRDGMMLVIGAGTGLGVGFVERNVGRVSAYASEGGHSEMPCYDKLTYAFHEWMSDRVGFPAGAELAVSGQGIANIFEFLCSDHFTSAVLNGAYETTADLLGREITAEAHSILQQPRSEWPALISKSARRNPNRDPYCALAMEVFVHLYGLKAANLASLFLPVGGVWLAGGISSKNEPWLIENDRFMRWFEKNYAPHIRQILSQTPVFIVKNYDISLLGAAVAALQCSSNA